MEELLRAVTSAEFAVSALARKLGLDPGSEIEITSPDLAMVEYSEPGFTLIEAWETAIANRKDYRTLALMVGLLDASADLNRDRPELILRGNYSYSDSTTGFAATQDSWSIVLNLSYNLFDGGRSESLVEQAEANRDAVNARL
jgi:outer membrane protein TolC